MDIEHIFRKSLLGFNREDVVEYIEQLMNEIGSARKECAELRNVIGSYEKAAGERESAVSALKQRVEELEKQLSSQQTQGEDDDFSLKAKMTPDDINKQTNEMLDGLDALLRTYLGGGVSDG